MSDYGIQPDEKQLSELASSGKASVRRKRGHFIYRVPVDWVAAAAILPGKCLAVGLALWFKFGVEKKRKVKVTRALLRKFGVNKDAGRRAINQLETAGMVNVNRGTGRSPVVTIVDVTPKEGDSDDSV